MDIRPAAAPDLPAIAAIVEAAYSPYIPRIGKKPGPMLDDYAALIGAGRVSVMVEAGRVLGLLVLLPMEGHMLLDNIAVAPDAQGRGVGKRLMIAAERAARAAGHDEIRLYTHEKMVENVAIYTRIGYRETHRIREKGFDRVYMAKSLGASPNT